MTMSSYVSLNAISRGARRWLTALTAVAVSLACASASAHVAFNAPPPNTTLVAGSAVQITWEDVIAHTTTAYHLELRTDPGTPGVAITADLPPTQHSLTWQVPTAPCAQCWLYILQDNDGTDYDAVDPISIVAEGTPTDGGTQTPPADSGGGGCAIAPARAPGNPPALCWLGLGIALALWGGRRGRGTPPGPRPTRAGPRMRRS
jgi:hypothetical protein